MTYPATHSERKLAAYDSISIDPAVAENVRALAFSASGGADPIDGIVTRALTALTICNGGERENATTEEVRAAVLDTLTTLAAQGPVSAPVLPGVALPVVAPQTAITKFAFDGRLTPTELTSYLIAHARAHAAAATPGLTLGALEQTLIYAERRRAEASFIDLALPELAVELGALEAAGLLAPGRAQEILTAPVQASERP